MLSWSCFLWILQTLRYEFQLFHESLKHFGLSFLWNRDCISVCVVAAWLGFSMRQKRGFPLHRAQPGSGAHPGLSEWTGQGATLSPCLYPYSCQGKEWTRMVEVGRLISHPTLPALHTSHRRNQQHDAKKKKKKIKRKRKKSSMRDCFKANEWGRICICCLPDPDVLPRLLPLSHVHLRSVWYNHRGNLTFAL
jgi:hypothetical protein